MSVRTTLAILAGALAMSLSATAQSPDWQDIIRNLRNPSAETRIESLEKLAEAAYTPAAEAVAPLVADPDDRVQAAAIEAELTFFLTERLGSRRMLSVGPSKSRAQEAFDIGPLVRVSTPAPPVLIDRLITAMRDENARLRFDAVHALGFIAEAPLQPAQAAALADELDHYDPLMRASTARVIGRHRVREGVPKLLAGLNDSSALVRRYAIESLGLLREERAVLPLHDIALKGRGDLVFDAFRAIAQYGSVDDLMLFRQRLFDRDALLRRASAEALGRAKDQDSIQSIRKLASTDSSASVKLAAAFALHLLGEPQTHIIAATLVVRDQTDQARDYLFEIGSPALPGVLEALKVATDSRHRADLIQFIGYLGTADMAATLQPLLNDRDPRVARAASNAIARLKR